MKRKKDLKIAISAGDPAGIGPEVILKSLNKNRFPGVVPIVIGSLQVFSTYYKKLFKGYRVINSPQEIDDNQESTYFIDVPIEGPLPELGNGSSLTGKCSLQYIDAALDMWLENEVDALVTAPVSKACIEQSGVPFTGHTEYIARRIGSLHPYMMMFSRKYRVLLVTTHIAIAEVPMHVTLDRMKEVIEVGFNSISHIDRGNVKLAVAGLDPHCGDQGAINTFDDEVTARAVEECRAEGIPVEGPFAADTLFMADKWAQYNLVIAQYHDQGLIPFKVLAFDRGVNVTLGLPLTRTSVDHGTAFDIAGRNIAGENSMTEAIKIAQKLESGKAPVVPLA